VPGVRAMFGSCLKGGWFDVRADERSARPLELHRPGWDTSGLEVELAVASSAFGGVAPLQIVHKKGVSRDGARPTMVIPRRCFVLSPEAGPWLDAGGVVAFCGVSPVAGHMKDASAIVSARRRQADELLSCTRYVQQSGLTSAQKTALRGDGEDGLAILSAVTREPQLFAAVAMRNGIFDALHPPPGAALPEWTGPHTPNFEEFAASVPYLDVGSRPLPVFLLQTWFGETARWTQSVKLAAKLEAAAPDRVAALLTAHLFKDDGSSGPKGEGDVEAEMQAFLLWQLAGEGANNVPTFSRDDKMELAIVRTAFMHARAALGVSGGVVGGTTTAPR